MQPVQWLLVSERRQQCKDVRMGNQCSALCCVLTLVLLWSTCGAHAATEPEGPTPLVQRLLKAMNSIKSTNNGGLSATDQATNSAAAKEANAILDIPAVGQ